VTRELRSPLVEAIPADAQLIGQLFKVGALMAQLHRAFLERTIVIPFFNALFHCPKLSFVFMS
jgi:hypothetical protein